MSQPSPHKPDPTALLAQAGARKRRRPLLVTVLFYAIPLGLLGLLVWWLWPRPELAQLELAAFDEVRLPNAPVKYRVHVQGVTSDGRRANAEGQGVFLLESKTGLQTKLTTGREGFAELEQAFPGNESLIHYLARIPKEKNRPGLEERGRVFTWTADSSILLVDADHSLAEIDTDKFWDTNNLQIKERPGAASALSQLAHKYRFMYLSAQADQPARYNKLRAWLEHGWAPQDKFPDGAVLCPSAHFPGNSMKHGEMEFLDRAAEQVKKRFQGRIVAVTSLPSAAELLQKQRVETFLLGQKTNPPKDVTLLKSWDELVRRLEK